MDKDTLPFISTPASKRTKRHYSNEEKREYIKRYEESGLTKQAFCRKHKISSAALYRWMAESNIKTSSPKEKMSVNKLQWNRVTPVLSPDTTSALELRFSDVLEMKLPVNTDPLWLNQLLVELSRCNFD